jgi:hypothetical protein
VQAIGRSCKQSCLSPPDRRVRFTHRAQSSLAIIFVVPRTDCSSRACQKIFGCQASDHAQPASHHTACWPAGFPLPFLYFPLPSFSAPHQTRLHNITPGHHHNDPPTFPLSSLSLSSSPIRQKVFIFQALLNKYIPRSYHFLLLWVTNISCPFTKKNSSRLIASVISKTTFTLTSRDT